MQFRELHNEPQNRLGGSPAGNPAAGGANLNSLRAEGQQLHRAGDDAILRALSSDSLAYNTSSQQDGGQ